MDYGGGFTWRHIDQVSSSDLASPIASIKCRGFPLGGPVGNGGYQYSLTAPPTGRGFVSSCYLYRDGECSRSIGRLAVSRSSDSDRGISCRSVEIGRGKK